MEVGCEKIRISSNMQNELEAAINGLKGSKANN